MFNVVSNNIVKNAINDPRRMCNCNRSTEWKDVCDPIMDTWSDCPERFRYVKRELENNKQFKAVIQDSYHVAAQMETLIKTYFMISDSDFYEVLVMIRAKHGKRVTKKTKGVHK